MTRRARPRVSVHVITYNHAEFIGAALQSAVDQDFDALEVVVADDGSQDGARDIISDYARRYPDRVIAILEGHLGIAPNANRAFRRCRGEFLAVLNGDDLFLPGKISRQVEWFERDAARTLCAHDVEHFDSATGERTKLTSQVTAPRSGSGPRDFITRGFPFASVAVMVKKAALQSYGFDERLRVVLDYKFAIDAVAKGGGFGFIEGVWARYRTHAQNSTVTQPQILWEDILTTLDLVALDYPEFADAARTGRAYRFFGRGVSELRAGAPRTARAWFKRALGQDWRVQPTLPAWFVLTLLPAGLRDLALRRQRNPGRRTTQVA